MPIIGTPVPVGCEGQATCAELQTLNPEVTLVEGKESTTKLIGVELSQAQVVTLKWIIRNNLGNPVDLSTCGTVTVKLRLKEAMAGPSGELVADLTGEIVDAAGGEVKASITATHTAEPGIYAGEWAILNSGGAVMTTSPFYFVVNPSLYAATTATKTGAPRLSEIRLHLRSSSPADSFLLETLEWDVAELAYAIRRPVDYWNEAAPPIGIEFNTQSFPYRFHWLEAITGELLLMAAHAYRRDHLPYTAAGVTVDDKNKWQQYETEGYRRRMLFEKFVLQKKAALNMDAGFGSFGSDYIF